MNSILMTIVVPCYNEAPVLNETAKRLRRKLRDLVKVGEISEKSRVVFVDDGSSDTTWEIIKKLNKSDKRFGGIKLSKNRGHQNALLAGLMTVKDNSDVVISMDADLQDDINAIDKMLEAYRGGAEIIYGVRDDRTEDSWFKRATAQTFYKIMSAMGVDSVYNCADYRLMSKRAVSALAEFNEVNLFLRGVVPLIGFKTARVTYKRGARLAGESKYHFKKMVNFAIDGITSFSVRPLRFITAIGFIVSLVGAGVLVYAFVQYLIGATVIGWTFTIFSIWLLGGLQIVSIGIVGEYIGKIYGEVKRRPRFIIERVI
jgi:glycosyltransferase involved in cell wall biosynthesis